MLQSCDATKSLPSSPILHFQHAGERAGAPGVDSIDGFPSYFLHYVLAVVAVGTCGQGQGPTAQTRLRFIGYCSWGRARTLRIRAARPGCGLG